MTPVGRIDSPVLAATAAVRWWVLLVIAIAWLAFGLTILQLDLPAARSIAVLTGLMLMVAAVSQLADMRVVRGHWAVHAALGGIFLTSGLGALGWPDPTFLELARLVGWVLLLKGCAHVVVALTLRDPATFWWLLLGVGVAEIVVALWAAAVPSASARVVFVWVGLIALTKGAADIVLAFGLREHTPAGPAQSSSIPGGAPW